MHGLTKIRRRGVLATVLGLGLVAGVAAMLGVPGTPPGVAGDHARAAAKPDWSEPVSDGSPTKVDYQRLEQRILSLMQDRDMVGLAVGTIERGQVRFLRGYGETLAGSGAPVTPDTVFRWASLSKGVAAALVAGLAEDGKLSLDAPLATMGTTLTLPGDASRVTVADVLSHRLGLVRNAWDDRLEAGADPKLLRAALGTLPPYCAPATCYAYQNVAFDTASEIVERTTGLDYASVAYARLFAPLGMTNASVGRAGLQGAASWAQPHHREKAPAIVNDSYYHVPAAGGVNSSIRDLTRWMRAQMGNSPEVLSPKTVELMHHARVPTPPHGRLGAMDRALANPAYGLGWRSFTYAGHALVGHRGAVDGYRSLILFDPSEKSGIVMLWNSNQFTAGRLQLEFFDMLYGLPPTDWLELKGSPDAEDAPADAEMEPGKAR
jgi:beta-lactamase class C